MIIIDITLRHIIIDWDRRLRLLRGFSTVREGNAVIDARFQIYIDRTSNRAEASRCSYLGDNVITCGQTDNRCNAVFIGAVMQADCCTVHRIEVVDGVSEHIAGKGIYGYNL